MRKVRGREVINTIRNKIDSLENAIDTECNKEIIIDQLNDIRIYLRNIENEINMED